MLPSIDQFPRQLHQKSPFPTLQLSLRGRLFSRADYQQLVLSAFPVVTRRLRLLPPAHVKPGPFWSGKQVISTVILNCLPEHLDGESFLIPDACRRIYSNRALLCDSVSVRSFVRDTR